MMSVMNIGFTGAVSNPMSAHTAVLVTGASPAIGATYGDGFARR